MSSKDKTEKKEKKNRKKSVGGSKAPFASELNFEASEAYNVLRTNLSLSLPGQQRGKIIGVTSSFPHEGKSYTTVNLCYALAKKGDKTVLVSADMRKPTVETYFQEGISPGLSNVLVGHVDEEDISSVIRHEEKVIENLYLLTAGDIPPNPSELISSKNMGTLLKRLANEFDYVIVDLPPVTTVVDPVAISPVLDGMLVVVCHGYTRKKMLVQTVKRLRFANVRILGFVYNGYRKHNGSYYRRKKKDSGTDGYPGNGYNYNS